MVLLMKHFNSFNLFFPPKSRFHHQPSKPSFCHIKMLSFADFTNFWCPRVIHFMWYRMQHSVQAILLPGLRFCFDGFFVNAKTNATIIYWPRLIGIASQCDIKPAATKNTHIQFVRKCDMRVRAHWCDHSFARSPINLSIVNYVKKP